MILGVPSFRKPPFMVYSEYIYIYTHKVCEISVWNRPCEVLFGGFKNMLKTMMNVLWRGFHMWKKTNQLNGTNGLVSCILRGSHLCLMPSAPNRTSLRQNQTDKPGNVLSKVKTNREIKACTINPPTPAISRGEGARGKPQIFVRHHQLHAIHGCELCI